MDLGALQSILVKGFSFTFQSPSTPNFSTERRRFNDDNYKVDASLWWDSFSTLLTELENASVTDGIPQSLAKKLNDNHAWFLDTVARFKSPNQKSREALDSAQFTVGSHALTVQPELKASALELSSVLVFYYLGELNDSLSYALGGGPLFDVSEDTDYVHTLLGK